MPNLDNWAGAGMATALGELVALKSTSITVKRGATTLAAQTVRLETLSGSRQMMGAGNVVHQIDAMVLGYKNHPTIADTDLQAGDRFAAAGVAYEVVSVMPGMVDNLQAYLRVRA